MNKVTVDNKAQFPILTPRTALLTIGGLGLLFGAAGCITTEAEANQRALAAHQAGVEKGRNEVLESQVEMLQALVLAQSMGDNQGGYHHSNKDKQSTLVVTGEVSPAAVQSEAGARTTGFTCADVHNEDPKIPQVEMFGFPSGVGLNGTETYSVPAINAKYGENYQNDGFARNSVAEPGKLAVKIVDVTPAMAPDGVLTVTVPNNAFLRVAAQEFLATDLESGRQVKYGERQDSMHVALLNGKVEGPDGKIEPLRVKFECFVPGHFQYSVIEEGTFASLDETKDVMLAGHSSTDSQGLPTTNCGGPGCRFVLPSGADFANSKTVDAWEQDGIDGKLRLVTTNFVQ